MFLASNFDRYLKDQVRALPKRQYEYLVIEDSVEEEMFESPKKKPHMQPNSISTIKSTTPNCRTQLSFDFTDDFEDREVQIKNESEEEFFVPSETEEEEVDDEAQQFVNQDDEIDEKRIESKLKEATKKSIIHDGMS